MAEALSARPWISLGPAHRPNGTPQLRYAVARESASTGELALVLISTAPIPGEQELAADIAERAKVASITRHTNNTPGDSLFDPQGEDVVLFGPGTLRENLCGVEVAVPLRAFSQVNPPQAAKMRELALSWLAPQAGDRALDLYSGVGEMTLSLAERGAQVVSVERVGAAVETARAAAQAKGLSLDARAGDAAASLSGLSRVNLAYLNPPRAGATPEALRALAALAPERVVYTSCSPQTFARDAALLAAQGYALEVVRPFDLFPQTAHVELVARFTRRPSA
jgi:23S rRNA (uracil1939-C5)-methyltransferase